MEPRIGMRVLPRLAMVWTRPPRTMVERLGTETEAVISRLLMEYWTPAPSPMSTWVPSVSAFWVISSVT